MKNDDMRTLVTTLFKHDNNCQLNEKPARIVGWELYFPLVAEMNGPLKVEFSWTTVHRIMNGDRKFKS